MTKSSISSAMPVGCHGGQEKQVALNVQAALSPLRGEQALDYHLTMTMMALAFCLKQRIAGQHNHPLLSCADIRDILCHLLPSNITDEGAILAMIQERHKRRAADIQRWHRLSAS